MNIHSHAAGLSEAHGVQAATQAACTIILPIPPTANTIWRRSGRRIHLSPDYTAWRNDAGNVLMAARFPKYAGRYALAIDLPRKMRGDLDNRVKGLSDLLVLMGIVEDDRFCDRISISRADDVPVKRCRMTVAAIKPEKEL